MPSNQTANYALSQWSRTDQVKMEDFNADNAKLDAALKAAADARSALQAALNTKGNCTVGLFTYIGTGKCNQANPTIVHFPKMPTVFIIAGNGLMVGKGGAPYASLTYYFPGGSSVTNKDVTWSGSTLSFYASTSDTPSMQLNSQMEYQVIAFYAES